MRWFPCRLISFRVETARLVVRGEPLYPISTSFGGRRRRGPCRRSARSTPRSSPRTPQRPLGREPVRLVLASRAGQLRPGPLCGGPRRPVDLRLDRFGEVKCLEYFHPLLLWHHQVFLLGSIGVWRLHRFQGGTSKGGPSRGGRCPSVGSSVSVRGDFACPSTGEIRWPSSMGSFTWPPSHGSDSCPEDAEWTMSGVETQSKHNCALNSQVDRQSHECETD